jgi:hypothetical protein
MIKGTATGADGRQVLMIGLSFGNLDKFRALPGDTFIKIDGTEMGLPLDVLIFSGETEAHMHKLVAGAIGPDTKFHIDPKLKS